MKISTLTSQGQVTIPAEIRRALNLQTGDLIQFKIADHKVIITKVSYFDQRYHRTLSKTLSEWDSDEDNLIYKTL